FGALESVMHAPRLAKETGQRLTNYQLERSGIGHLTLELAKEEARRANEPVQPVNPQNRPVSPAPSAEPAQAAPSGGSGAAAPSAVGNANPPTRPESAGQGVGLPAGSTDTGATAVPARVNDPLQ